MENLDYKIKAYAKANGVNTVDFQTDVIIVKPSDGDARIDVWNLSIAEPTTEQLNALETEANELKAVDDAKPTAQQLKLSAKAKLVAGEALTQEEADTIVL